MYRISIEADKNVNDVNVMVEEVAKSLSEKYKNKDSDSKKG